jgi:hypothetical protein
MWFALPVATFINFIYIYMYICAYHKNESAGLGMPLILIFTRAAHRLAHNNSYFPWPKRKKLGHSSLSSLKLSL